MEERIVKVKRTGEHVVRYESVGRKFYKSVLEDQPVMGRVRLSKRTLKRSGDAEGYHFRFWAKFRRLFAGKD
jgi:hypothetical protein